MWTIWRVALAAPLIWSWFPKKVVRSGTIRLGFGWKRLVWWVVSRTEWMERTISIGMWGMRWHKLVFVETEECVPCFFPFTPIFVPLAKWPPPTSNHRLNAFSLTRPPPPISSRCRQSGALQHDPCWWFLLPSDILYRRQLERGSVKCHRGQEIEPERK